MLVFGLENLGIRIDGDSENIARALIFMCEQLVSECLFLSCRISRGKVDIILTIAIVCFAKIAINTQLQHIKTVSSYANLIKSSSKADGNTDADTAFILPDFYTDATV